ncbi:dTDP-4-dehydrorhamnose 3,5-epimerase family protein [Gemmata sp. JC673]|uniref:dTDP-4-dehydrorhamnose 3,5-epimerase n=1 Tax=Gemmata algarum TaxID=2975278 RepID=A0ABU5ETG0_9BACT|nr:dTDP-4-dehydrorhamnose 3,5-epimerase family protein [Gemmata algarum]MDY3557762.1 dTDP-4-dehydrorhamnose 3,5-epimerase family protein [Gemmata algarum]
MLFLPTELPGVFVIEPEPTGDDRGLFARTYCAEEFARHGLCTQWAQCNVSFNTRAGTLRGMHWQAAPDEEVKLVRCTAGAALDVVADARPDSPTYRKWVAVELTAANRRAVYIPGGYAHGFQTRADGTELFYQMSAFYVPGAARGARWDDPALGIAWPPCDRRVIAPRDLSFPDLPT